MRVFRISLLIMAVVFLYAGVGYGAHPLTTDDTGTQGKGKYQIEMMFELSKDKERESGISVKQTGKEAAVALSYGIMDNSDIIIEIPYVWEKTKEDGSIVSDTSGLSDISLSIKWRFYEKDSFKLAIKPSISLPTGDEEEGLGDGKPSYEILLISSKEFESLTLHANIGYLRRDYKLKEDKDILRKNILKASAAVEYNLMASLRAVGNIEIETNEERASSDHPVSMVLGAIYSPREDLDLDIGIRFGLNDSAQDIAGLAGITWRF